MDNEEWRDTAIYKLDDIYWDLHKKFQSGEINACQWFHYQHVIEELKKVLK